MRTVALIMCCMMSLTIFGQKKELNAAREDIRKNRNLERVEQTMMQLLADSAHRENEKVWDMLFESLRRQYELGNEKLYLNQKYDTLSLFRIASRMLTAMEAYDSIDARPDARGRVKLGYRRANAEVLHQVRPNLYRGGLFLIRRQKYAEAFDLLRQYIDCATHPLFEGYRYTERDANLPRAAYWALYSGYKLNDGAKVMLYADLAQRDEEHHNLVLQYLAESYLWQKDTVRSLEVLHEGFDRYPQTPFFFSHLIDHYTRGQQWQTAMELTDKAISRDSTNVTYWLTRGSICLNMGRYAESYAISDSLLQRNDSLPEAHLNAGLARFNEAVMLDKMAQSVKRRRKILGLYQEAMPHLEAYRAKRPDRIDAWGLPLYTIYLNLNMGKKFDEIDRLMRQ